MGTYIVTVADGSAYTITAAYVHMHHHAVVFAQGPASDSLIEAIYPLSAIRHVRRRGSDASGGITYRAGTEEPAYGSRSEIIHRENS